MLSTERFRCHVSRHCLAIGLGAAVLLPVPAWATGDAQPAGDVNDPIVVTGTREAGRGFRDSPKSIEVVGAAQLAATGQTNVLDALQRILPSLNTMVAGNASLFRSFSLKGLSPGQTLILINGKRRHQSSYLFKQASPYQGTNPVDLDMIPVAAIDHIEVLRDGAAAQYGTDAIAGVINIILKHADHGGSVTMLGGQTYKGDGANIQGSANAGFSFGGNGFMNITGDVHYHDYSNRSGYDTRSGTPVQGRALGDPLSTVEAFSFNAEKPLSSSITAYGFGTLSHRFGDVYQARRLPTVAPAVYPDGFFPRTPINEFDFGLTLGLKGGSTSGIQWDISTTAGGDEEKIETASSLNVNLYNQTGNAQTSFYNGKYASSQITNNIDLKKEVDTGLWSSPLTIAAGFEHRYETFRLSSGEYNSYILGGSQGLQGFTPATASNTNRDVEAAYLDLSTHFTQKWQIDAAGRFEHYPDAGNAWTGQFSTRYDFSQLLGIRGSVGNGFHAPTLAQQSYAASTIGPTSASGQIPLTSPGARILGAPNLGPEKSISYSVGLLSNPAPRLHLSVDAYQISIRKRIINTGLLTGPIALAALAANGNELPYGISSSAFSAQFFFNGADTRTRGIDANADYHLGLGEAGNLDLSMGVGYNKTRITKYRDAGSVLAAAGVQIFTPTVISYLTSATPHWKSTLSATWTKSRWTVTARGTYYSNASEWVDPAGKGLTFYKVTTGKAIIADLDVGYRLTSRLSFDVGADNLFNHYPRNSPVISRTADNAQIYPTFSPYGFDGGYYFGKVTFTF